MTHDTRPVIGFLALIPFVVPPIILAVLLASLSWYLYERPINALKRYFPYLDDDASGHFQVGRGFDKNPGGEPLRGADDHPGLVHPDRPGRERRPGRGVLLGEEPGQPLERRAPRLRAQRHAAVRRAAHEVRGVVGRRRR